MRVPSLARELGMLKLGTVALSYEHAQKMETRLQQEVTQLLRLAEAADEVEIPDRRVIPAELERREIRLSASETAARSPVTSRPSRRTSRPCRRRRIDWPPLGAGRCTRCAGLPAATPIGDALPIVMTFIATTASFRPAGFASPTGRRTSVMSRACGSPDTPLRCCKGRNPANRYASAADRHFKRTSSAGRRAQRPME